MTDATASPTRIRYLVMVLVALASTTAYLTRHAIAPSATTIQAETGITSEQMGYILSVMSIGYFVFQIPTGWLGTRFGTRFALPFLCVVWSACAVWFAAVSSFWGFIWARMMFGGAQAGLVPNAAKAVKDWFPPTQRGLASAASGSAMSVGGAISIALTAVLLESFSWRTAFVMWAGVSLIWAAGFYLLFRTKPEEHPWVNESEVAEIHSDEAESSDSGTEAVEPSMESQPTFREHAVTAASSLSMWALCVQSAFKAAGYQMFVTWFPAFLEKGYGVTRESAGLMASSPLIGVVIGSMAGGVITDWLLVRTGEQVHQPLRRRHRFAGAFGLVVRRGFMDARPDPARGRHGARSTVFRTRRSRRLDRHHGRRRTTNPPRHGADEHGRDFRRIHSADCRRLHDRQHRTHRRRLEPGSLSHRRDLLGRRPGVVLHQPEESTGGLAVITKSRVSCFVFRVS